MSYYNKKHIKVRKDKTNKWYNFSWKDVRIQLCWHQWKDKWFFLEFYAKKAWKFNFIKDFTEILALMEKDNAAIFSLYELKDKSEK